MGGGATTLGAGMLSRGFRFVTCSGAETGGGTTCTAFDPGKRRVVTERWGPRSGRDRADVQLGRGPQLIRRLGSGSHCHRRQCRSAQRRAHSFGGSGAGKRFQRQQIGHGGIRLRQIRVWARPPRFRATCCRAPPGWFAWDDAPHARRSGRNDQPPRRQHLRCAEARCRNSKLRRTWAWAGAS